MTEHNHDTDIEIAKDILRQARTRLEEELADLGFSVVGQVYNSSEPPYTATMLFSASLQWIDEGRYTLLPKNAKPHASPCENDGHDWVESEDDDGDPYDQCEVCKSVRWL